MRTFASVSRTLAILTVIISTVAAQKESKGKLDLELLLDWESVSSPRLSPDGKQVVFTRRWADKINDKSVSDLWIMGADGSRPRFLVKGSGVRWAPDGERILYTAEGKPKGSQLWVMWVKTREATQITHLERGPSRPVWSPDGKRIAFSMVVPEKESFKIKLPPRPKGAKWAESPKVITRLQYRRDRRGYRPKGWRHLFVVDANGGTPRQVTKGDFDHRAAEWTPDGKTLVFSGLREEDADWQVRESEIYTVSIPTGAIRRLTRRSGPDHAPTVSPDGRLIAYMGFDKNLDTYNDSKIYLMNADGSGSRILVGGIDRPKSGLMWQPDSSALLFTVNSEGTSNLHEVDISTGKVRHLTGGTHMLRASHVCRSGAIVGTVTTAHRPADIVRVEGGGAIVRLLGVNDDLLDHVKLGAVEEIRYKSTDGLPIQGWIIKPPEFDPSKKYPMILQIHGGPHGMYNVGFDFERQNHAAEGFVVLYTNPRGSAGYGKAFGNAINNAYPGQDYDDLMRGVDEMIAKGYVDENKLFVFGGSGGGVLTAWIVGHTDRFKGAVSMYPVINWISFVGTTDGPYWYTNFRSLPWEDVSEHWNRSPLKYAGNVTTATLLITGELDLRTPMSQTEEFYQALKLRKVDTAMIRVPGEYHGAAGKHVSNRLRRILYVREWFNRHMPKPAAPDGGGGSR